MTDMENRNGDIEGGGCAEPPCSAWRTIEDARPAVGDLIACCALDESGSRIFWAGHIAEQAESWSIMMRNDDDELFVLTYDTLWLKIPEPNDLSAGTDASEKTL